MRRTIGICLFVASAGCAEAEPGTLADEKFTASAVGGCNPTIAAGTILQWGEEHDAVLGTTYEREDLYVPFITTEVDLLAPGETCGATILGGARWTLAEARQGAEPEDTGFVPYDTGDTGDTGGSGDSLAATATSNVLGSVWPLGTACQMSGGQPVLNTQTNFPAGTYTYHVWAYLDVSSSSPVIQWWVGDREVNPNQGSYTMYAVAKSAPAFPGAAGKDWYCYPIHGVVLSNAAGATKTMVIAGAGRTSVDFEAARIVEAHFVF